MVTGDLLLFGHSTFCPSVFTVAGGVCLRIHSAVLSRFISATGGDFARHHLIIASLGDGTILPFTKPTNAGRSTESDVGINFEGNFGKFLATVSFSICKAILLLTVVVKVAYPRNSLFRPPRYTEYP